MHFSLPFSTPKFPFELSHGAPIVLLGSCFSDELEDYFKNSGFYVCSNPFGTLFHPLALSSVIQSSIDENATIDVYKRGDIYFSWDASSKVFGMSEEVLKSFLLNQRKHTREQIASAQTLIITFGSAFGYRHHGLNTVVGNCHKAPKDTFSKELSSLDLMLSEWLKTIEEIKSLNPSVELIFTVSPVRHSKDGLIENNRSKGRLIELAHRICEETSSHYFPSYEIVIDELRDYRFFNKDLVHPNKLAIDYVWEQFSNSTFSEQTKGVVKKVNAYYQMVNHKLSFPESEEAAKHTESIKRLREEILNDYPTVVLP